MEIISGNIIDIFGKEIYPGDIYIEDKKIKRIERNANHYDSYISPGLIDAHVHIESSMLTPENFSKMVIQFGTVGVVHDPHEIANVLGVPGINFMYENSKKALIKCFCGIPSCVPATPFDKGGAVITSIEIEELANTGRFITLSEIMNIPGVLGGDEEIIKKLAIARKYKLPIDGHAPKLRGADLKKYIKTGILTDHEVDTEEEALEKMQSGMKIIIREGSAAKNYQRLKHLIKTHPHNLFFCTDDAHPDEILKIGHMDRFLRMAQEDGLDLFDVLSILSINPISHYNLSVGCLREGDSADFIRIENLESFKTLETYIDGEKRYDYRTFQRDLNIKERCKNQHPNNFLQRKVEIKDIAKPVRENEIAIGISENEIITDKYLFHSDKKINLESDIDKDILKIVYLNRYKKLPPQVAFIHGVGLREGAFGSTISHDSHNLLVVGCSDREIVDVINTIMENQGGLAVKYKEDIHLLSLPIGGIMSDQEANIVSDSYEKSNNIIHSAGSLLKSPFMTLAFMSLIVIPEIKIGERGLFDFSTFRFIE